MNMTLLQCLFLFSLLTVQVKFTTLIVGLLLWLKVVNLLLLNNGVY